MGKLIAIAVASVTLVALCLKAPEFIAVVVVAVVAASVMLAMLTHFDSPFL